MRLAFVVPRYGRDVVGGAETLVRGDAEHLAAAGHQVEVLTTCALDHFSWRNDLPASDRTVDGVRVRRFPVTRPKDHELATSLHARLDAGFPLDAAGERAWVENSGHSEALLAALDETGQRVDAILFAPYLFPTTVLGVHVHPERSIVIPCLHDEPYARFAIVREALTVAAGIVLNTRAEAELLHRVAGESVASRVVGAGLDPVDAVDPARGLRLARLDAPFVAYAGRREAAKNFPTLLRWLALHNLALDPAEPVGLATMGSGAVDAPLGMGGLVRDLGSLSVVDKMDVISAAHATIQLSLQESFSFLLMEGWQCGIPGIVHAGCAVTREHCGISGGGLWVESAEECSAALGRLSRDSFLRQRMGAAGRRYVESEYAWPAVLARLESAIRDLVGVA